eukprot:922262-Pelagomonas_calceolata.AAC.15
MKRTRQRGAWNEEGAAVRCMSQRDCGRKEGKEEEGRESRLLFVHALPVLTQASGLIIIGKDAMPIKIAKETWITLSSVPPKGAHNRRLNSFGVSTLHASS